jgi:hypothetical protein
LERTENTELTTQTRFEELGKVEAVCCLYTALHDLAVSSRNVHLVPITLKRTRRAARIERNKKYGGKKKKLKTEEECTCETIGNINTV